MRRAESVRLCNDGSVGRGAWDGQGGRRFPSFSFSSARLAEGVLLRSVVAAFVVCSVASCASTSTQGNKDVAGSEIQRSEAQQEAVADADVTLDEYRAGFRRFQSCLSAQGYELHGVAVGDVLIDYGVPDVAVESGTEADCYQSEFELVDMEWQVKNEDTSYTAEVSSKCLAENGVAPEDTLAEMTEQLEAAGIKFEDCLE